MNHHFSKARVGLPHDTVTPSNAQFYVSKPITIIVGPQSNQRAFYLHEALLSAESECFKKVLNGNFLEGPSEVIRLEEVDPAAFDLFARRLYSEQSWADPEEDLTVLIDAFVLGDMLLAPAFNHRVLRQLQKHLRNTAVSIDNLIKLVRSTYELTQDINGRSLRAILARCYAARRQEAPTQWPSRMRWTEADEALLLESGLDEFQLDIMRMVLNPYTRMKEFGVCVDQ